MLLGLLSHSPPTDFQRDLLILHRHKAGQPEPHFKAGRPWEETSREGHCAHFFLRGRPAVPHGGSQTPRGAAASVPTHRGPAR